MAEKISKIECHEFTYPLSDVTADSNGFNLTYSPGDTYHRHAFAIGIETSNGLRGEYVGGTAPGATQIRQVARYLLGKNPFHREKHWSVLRNALRKYDQVGIGPLDIALWDLAGKDAGRPIHELLGSYRSRLPAYASTYFATDGKGFKDAESFADFAQQCLSLGFPAFKLHTWKGTTPVDIDREIETVRTVAEKVGDEMHLMLDPVCEYPTFLSALEVGKACDRYDYLWYEDPYGDVGESQHGNRTLREHLQTPVLHTEMVRGLEPHADAIVENATDLVRADVEWDGGITGAMKIARVAESFGVDVEYHLPGPAVRHCMAATRNTNYYELGLVHPESPLPHTEAPIYAGGYTDSMDSIHSDGTYPVPVDPGLGVTYDWDYIFENSVDIWSFS